MVLTSSVVSSTTSQAINATDVIVAVDTTGSMAVADATSAVAEKTITPPSMPHARPCMM